MASWKDQILGKVHDPVFTGPGPLADTPMDELLAGSMYVNERRGLRARLNANYWSGESKANWKEPETLTDFVADKVGQAAAAKAGFMQGGSDRRKWSTMFRERMIETSEAHLTPQGDGPYSKERQEEFRKSAMFGEMADWMAAADPMAREGHELNTLAVLHRVRAHAYDGRDAVSKAFSEHAIPLDERSIENAKRLAGVEEIFQKLEHRDVEGKQSSPVSAEASGSTRTDRVRLAAQDRKSREKDGADPRVQLVQEAARRRVDQEAGSKRESRSTDDPQL